MDVADVQVPDQKANTSHLASPLQYPDDISRFVDHASSSPGGIPPPYHGETTRPEASSPRAVNRLRENNIVPFEQSLDKCDVRKARVARDSNDSSLDVRGNSRTEADAFNRIGFQSTHPRNKSRHGWL